MFCSKCGTQALDGATFCQKCGAKLMIGDTEQQAAAPAPAGQVQSQANNPQSNIPKKKKSKKLPMILGALALIFVVIIIAVNFDDLQERGEQAKKDEEYIASQQQSAAITLSETYTNEAEGFSFQYPSDWTVMDGKELYDASLDDTAVVSLYAPDGFGSASNVLVNKTQADYTLFDYTKSDFEQEFSSIFDEVSVTGLSNVNIDGVPAIELGLSINTGAGPLVVVRYYYIVGDYTYIISGTIRQSAIDSDGPVIDAIIGSYTITAANTSGESGTKSSYPFISYGYGAIPVDYLLESVDNVIFQLGDSQLNDEFKLRYDDLEFYHDNGAITSIVCTDPSLLEADGVPLNKNREGLISIFGQPHEEGNDGGGYFMSYDLPYCSLYFELGEPDSEAWRISISPNEGSEPAPGELLYNGEPIARLLGSKLEELNQIFGAPTDTGILYGATEYYTYNDISFMLDDQGAAVNITVAADAAEINGATLDQNRTGIIHLLGTPGYEELLPEDESGEGLGGYYMMEYTSYEDLIIMTVQLPDADSKAYNVTISRYDDGPGDEE